MSKKSTKHTLTQDELWQAYSDMLLYRRFEERAANLYQQGLIGGFCHLYIGQEAVLAGAKAASLPEDDFITSYRCHAHALARGVEAKHVMAELTGRVGGISRGKGGSMHMFDPDKHYWGGHGIVGAQLPLGTGLAFSNKYLGKNTACLTFIGDGAMNQGQVFESFNMAALWGLPVLYIIENNQWGMGSAASHICAGNLWQRGEPFGIPGQKVDGQDFFAVYAAIRAALDSIRAGNGPQIIEMDTYRYRGHSMSDPAKYRTREDVDKVKQSRDPIARLHTHLVKEYSVKESAFSKLDDTIKAQVMAAVEFAEQSPEPAAEELYTDIIPEN